MQNWDSSMSERIPFDLSGRGCKVVSILLSIFENQDTLTLKYPTLYQSIIDFQGCDNFDGGSFPLVSTKQLNPLQSVGIIRFLDFLNFFSGTCSLVQLFETRRPLIFYQLDLSNLITQSYSYRPNLSQKQSYSSTSLQLIPVQPRHP